MTHSYKYKVCRVLFLLFTPQSPCRQIVGKELFSVLREKHGAAFQSLVQEKVSPLAGDMTHEGLGLESTRAKQLAEEVDIIVNGAAITNFYERYTSQSHGTWYSAHVSGTVPGTWIPYRERGSRIGNAGTFSFQ